MTNHVASMATKKCLLNVKKLCEHTVYILCATIQRTIELWTESNVVAMTLQKKRHLPVWCSPSNKSDWKPCKLEANGLCDHLWSRFFANEHHPVYHIDGNTTPLEIKPETIQMEPLEKLQKTHVWRELTTSLSLHVWSITNPRTG